MSRRTFVGSLCVVAFLGLVLVDVSAQGGQKTAWGDPDLTGAYTLRTTTPLEPPRSWVTRSSSPTKKW